MPGAVPPYVERLTPPRWWYAVAVLIGGSFGLVLLPFAGTAGLAVGGLGGAAVGVAILVLTSARIEVGEGTFRAGRAAIPIHLLGPATVLDADEVARLRGRDIDPRAYLCQRGWVPTGVRVDVSDPGDPTPYWLVSSHQPERLADAIEAQRQRG